MPRAPKLGFKLCMHCQEEHVWSVSEALKNKDLELPKRLHINLVNRRSYTKIGDDKLHDGNATVLRSNFEGAAEAAWEVLRSFLRAQATRGRPRRLSPWGARGRRRCIRADRAEARATRSAPHNETGQDASWTRLACECPAAARRL